jgi:hypothetical protein
VPFEHVLPREIILHINWLTVGACRETGNRYSKYERSEYREYDYGIIGPVYGRAAGKTFIFPATRTPSYVQISRPDNAST